MLKLTQQEEDNGSQERIDKEPGYSRSYDKWNREDNRENRVYRENSRNNRGTEMSWTENK